ncbi:cyclin-like protein [Cyathus striatus]|nr:cyclin-like protein [Cyathus striatus]
MFVDDPEHLDLLAIYFANIITKLGKKLQLRQRVIATATVFFRRFYLKNSYCETDPFFVIAACIYVAAKAEEYPVHIKNVVSEAKTVFSHNYGIKNFPLDNTKLAEMEMRPDRFPPYRTLLALCRKSGAPSSGEVEEGEAGELGIGIGEEDGERYWGSGEGQLELGDGPMQLAWFIINDTYRSDLCLLYPPHLIAIAAIYLTFVQYPPPMSSPSSSSQSPPTSAVGTSKDKDKAPRRSSRHSSSNSSEVKKGAKKPSNDPITFLAELNVSLSLIATISQEIISLYTRWERYKEDGLPEGGSRFSSQVQSQMQSQDSPTPTPSTPTPSTPGREEASFVTPGFLAALVSKMREAKWADAGGGKLVNKVLEGARSAG